MNIRPCHAYNTSEWFHLGTANIKHDTPPNMLARALSLAPRQPILNDEINKWTLLGYTAYLGNVALIDPIFKVEGKESLRTGDFHGWTPLFCAASCEDPEKGYRAVRALLSKGSHIYINTATSKEYNDPKRGVTPSMATPLWAAAVKMQSLKLVKLLLVHGGAIHPDTENEYIDPTTKERRHPLTLINKAKAESENWKLLRYCNHHTKSNKIPKELMILISHYLDLEMPVPPPKPQPRKEELEEDMLSDLFKPTIGML